MWSAVRRIPRKSADAKRFTIWVTESLPRVQVETVRTNSDAAEDEDGATGPTYQNPGH